MRIPATILLRSRTAAVSCSFVMTPTAKDNAPLASGSDTPSTSRSVPAGRDAGGSASGTEGFGTGGEGKRGQHQN